MSKRVRDAVSGMLHARRWLERNAYLVLAAAALLVITNTVQFDPPPQVRVGTGPSAELLGNAPRQEFSTDVDNPQAVQVRATLRLYAESAVDVMTADPRQDEGAKLLSQPIVTTLYGLRASIDQTVRLAGGDTEVHVHLEATPRLLPKPRAELVPPIEVEHVVEVTSVRRRWWRSSPKPRVHVHERAFLTQVENDGHRLVFTVDEHVFRLDLELHRPRARAPSIGAK